jgi:hypothetical protein
MPIHPPSTPGAGIVIDLVSDVAGTMILLTGLVAAASRTFAVLAGSPPEKVELFTALGFLGGVAVSAILLALDVVVR